MICYLSSVLLKMVPVGRWKLRSLKFWIVNWHAVTSAHMPLAKVSHMADLEVRGRVMALLSQSCVSQSILPCMVLGQGWPQGTLHTIWKVEVKPRPCLQLLQTCWPTLLVQSSSWPPAPLAPTRSCSSASLGHGSGLWAVLRREKCPSSSIDLCECGAWRQWDAHVGLSLFFGLQLAPACPHHTYSFPVQMLARPASGLAPDACTTPSRRLLIPLPRPHEI